MHILNGTCKDTGKLVYVVSSNSEPNKYYPVWREADGFHCTCKSFKLGRKASCIHTNAVKIEICDAMEYIGAKWLPPCKSARKPAPVIRPAKKAA
jgi:hypothetical protein